LIDDLIRHPDHPDGQLLPLGYHEQFKAADSEQIWARVCCDFIDSLTEDYLLRFHQRIFGSASSALLDFF
jgi:dGTP triphosphohydrolase